MPIINSRYLDGVKEGRATLNLQKAAGVPLSSSSVAETIADLERFRERAAACAHCADIIEFLDGELDFWREQAKRLSGAQAAALVGTTTLTEHALRNIRALGYQINVSSHGAPAAVQIEF